mmetsp:Transcript_34481/g.45356  ORF Transcript_34481/g.45356 Transcript_34481/m.45356 type:complete len:89 (-) Transcript_34481:372-638(-)
MVCDEVGSEKANCHTANGLRVLRILKSVELKPIRLQIDNVVYEVPFDRLWDRAGIDTFVLRAHYKEEMIIFGLSFLNSYYQAFDLKRS